jgi:hypothetical protein
MNVLCTCDVQHVQNGKDLICCLVLSTAEQLLQVCNIEDSMPAAASPRYHLGMTPPQSWRQAWGRHLRTHGSAVGLCMPPPVHLCDPSQQGAPAARNTTWHIYNFGWIQLD